MSNGGYKGASPARETSPEQYPGVWELTEQFQAQADGNWPFQAADCAPKSLRFDEGSVTSLTKTFAIAGNRRVFTWNFWVKLATLSENNIAVVGSGSPNSIRFNANGTFQIKACGGSLTTSAVFRDFSAFYGITVAVDSTAPVATDRIKLFVNGEDFTSDLTGTSATLNGEANWNTAAAHYIGKQEHNNSNMLDGLLSEVTFIDGQALSCEEFGFFDGQGIWQPKRFTGDYSNGPVYSNLGRFNTGNTAQSSYPVTNLFDGNLSTEFKTNQNSGTYTFPFVANVQPGDIEVYSVGISNEQFQIRLRNNGSQVAVAQVDTSGSMAWISTSQGVGGASSYSGPIDEIQLCRISNKLQVGGIKYKGVMLTDASVGRNSFHLDFSDGANDQSGLGNDWTATNLAFTAGAFPASGYRDDSSVANSPWNNSNSVGTTSNTLNNDEIYWVDLGQSVTTNKITVDVAITGTDTNSSNYFVYYTTNPAATGSNTWSASWSVTGGGTTGNLNLTLTGTAVTGRYFGLVNGNGGTSATFVFSNFKIFPADQLACTVDSPVNGHEASTGAGNERRGNYCTLNPLSNDAFTMTNGNLSGSSQGYAACLGTIAYPKSGKWYYEFSYESVPGYNHSGIATGSTTLTGQPGYDVNTQFTYWQNGSKTNNVSYGASFAANDVIGVAFDADAGSLVFYKNGVSQGVNATGLTTDTYFPYISAWNYVSHVNFGQLPFSHPVTGYSPLATSFLPETTIKRGDEAATVALYTGNQGGQTVENLRLSPDLVWIKNRSTNPSSGHYWHIHDTVRGKTGNFYNALYTNGSESENTYAGSSYGGLSDITDDGFTLSPAAGYSPAHLNANGTTYAAFCWDAGETTTTIAAGGLNSSAYNRSQIWSDNITTTGNSGNWSSTAGIAKDKAFNGDDSNYAHANANGSTAAVVTLTFSPALACNNSVSFMGGVTSSGTGTISINGGTATELVNAGTNPNASHKTTVNFTGNITTITISKTSTGAQGLLVYGFEVDNARLIDKSPALGKTLTRFRAKTDWNWHRIAAVKVNGTTLTTGTLDNSGSVWTDPDEWKDGNANSSNATYSQSARGDWFDVTLASNIANFSELQFYMQLDSAAGSTTNIYEIELFFSDGTSYLRTYATNSDAPNQANYQFNSWQWQNFGDLGLSVANVPLIATTVRARPETGFSIATYTGNSTGGASVAHGLNKKPDFFMIGCRNVTNGNYWDVWHSAWYVAGTKNYMRMASGSTNGAKYAADMFQTPTAFVNTLGSSSSHNGNHNYVMYSWTAVEGYSAFGEFEGVGSESTGNGPFVWCGFKPAVILWKSHSVDGSNWFIVDTFRHPDNVNDAVLRTNSNGAETDSDYIDVLSNGFKVRATPSLGGAGSGYKFLYAAWAENPFGSQTRAN